MQELFGNFIAFFYVFKENARGFSEVWSNIDEIFILYIFNSKVLVKMEYAVVWILKNIDDTFLTMAIEMLVLFMFSDN